MTSIPENRRRDEALRRYMLAADTLAAIAEMLVEGDGDDSPVHRVVANSVRNLELAKVGVRALGADPYEPAGAAAGVDQDITITTAAAPDASAMEGLCQVADDLDDLANRMATLTEELPRSTRAALIATAISGPWSTRPTLGSGA